MGLSALLWVCSLSPLPAPAHSLQSSLTEITWLVDRPGLQVVHSVHLDDAMVLLAALGSAEGVLSLEAEARLMLYLEQHFSLSLADQPLALQPVGAQIQGDFLWLYQELDDVPVPSGLQVRMTLMQELFAGQRNQVNLQIGDEVRSLHLHKDQPQGSF